MIMRGIDLIASFELEINKLDNALEKPVTDDSIYWINQAATKFTRERFNGVAPHFTGYEQTEKRTRDLINLYREQSFVTPEPDTSHPSYDSYEYDYPEDMLYTLNENVIISSPDGENPLDVCVFECTADSFMYRVMNKLTDFHYRFKIARPLRVKTKNGFRLLTDKNYTINKYTLGYLKVPEEITNTDPYTEYKDFEDYTWSEIIKIAAQMYVENQSDPRYKTLTNEVLTQE